MPHVLRKSVLGSNPIIEIGAERKDSILAAWANLYQVVEIEEAWDNLIQNFIELELATLQISLESMASRRGSYREFQDHRQLLSRRFSNLLQTCKFYLDSTPAHLRKIAPKWEAEFARLLKEAKDNSFDFRFIYELRNHAQHRGQPLHRATYHSEKVDPRGDGADQIWQFRFAVTLWIDPSEVAADTRHQELRKELSQLKDDIDAFETLRGFLEALGEVHWNLREAMSCARAEWTAVVRDAIAEYSTANDGDVLGLTVATMTDDRRVVLEEKHIFDAMIDRVEELIRRNGSLKNLPRRHVTNRIVQ